MVQTPPQNNTNSELCDVITDNVEIEENSNHKDSYLLICIFRRRRLFSYMGLSHLEITPHKHIKIKQILVRTVNGVT